MILITSSYLCCLFLLTTNNVTITHVMTPLQAKLNDSRWLNRSRTSGTLLSTLIWGWEKEQFRYKQYSIVMDDRTWNRLWLKAFRDQQICLLLKVDCSDSFAKNRTEHRGVFKWCKTCEVSFQMQRLGWISIPTTILMFYPSQVGEYGKTLVSKFR